MDVQKATKFVVRHLVRSGTSAATANLVAAHRNHSDNQVVDTYQKSAALVGGFAVGWMVGDHVAAFAENKVDEAFTWFHENFKKN